MITSKNTSVNKTKVPVLFSLVDWEPGTINVDYGAGKYETATEYLKHRGILNLSMDPYNREKEENDDTELFVVCRGGVDTVTCSNVLNVIQDKKDRYECISKCWQSMKCGGTAYFTVYEGDQSGVGRQTKADCWQENRKTEDYVKEVEEVFPQVRRQGKLIIAR